MIMTQPKNKQKILKTILDKVKMVSSGIKNKSHDTDVPCCVEEKDVRYPMLFLTTKEAPTLEGSEVEDEVTLVLKAVIVGRRMDVMKGKDKRENFDLEIHKIGKVSSSEEETKD